DTALFPEYHVSTPTWSVCHNFMTRTLLETVEVHEGWNTIQFTTVTNGTANLSHLEIVYPV
ncbi:MAG: hypothetical protein J6B04_03430, partial [Clostridia bacterium]|nr:hypothetical protein [Clostridia bacterium]